MIVKIGGKEKKLFHRIAPCNGPGVIVCPVDDSEYVAPIAAQRSMSSPSKAKTSKSK